MKGKTDATIFLTYDRVGLLYQYLLLILISYRVCFL